MCKFDSDRKIFDNKRAEEKEKDSKGTIGVIKEEVKFRIDCIKPSSEPGYSDILATTLLNTNKRSICFSCPTYKLRDKTYIKECLIRTYNMNKKLYVGEFI